MGRVGRVIRGDGRGITVQLGAEYWHADADDADFEIGDRALVTGIDHLRLRVRREAENP